MIHILLVFLCAFVGAGVGGFIGYHIDKKGF